jgi:hypothetical protein
MTDDRQEAMGDDRQQDAPDAEGEALVDPASKTQPAEGGREEVDESLDRSTTDEGLTRGAANER